MILVVCTGNICRSPVVEALLRHELSRLSGACQSGERPAVAGPTVDGLTVESAGTLGWNSAPMSPESAQVLRERGVDADAHTSRRMTPAMAAGADLVIGMTREHLWAVEALVPQALPWSFVLGELVRLGTSVGPRGGAPLPDWVASVDALRGPQRLALAEDELDDPLGEPVETYREMADRAHDQVRQLAALLTGSAPLADPSTVGDGSAAGEPAGRG